MGEKRTSHRVGCFTKCFLYHDGATYGCILENLSFSGALIKMGRPLPDRLRQGDRCSLVLCGDPVISPGEYNSTIARLNFPRIGLHFQEKGGGA
ncbi:PilZ domain-containing protein [Oryzomonas rubra]|uniref:PilZ domain-containing protein n=1 Tax=Oryzomonas rubra TaxID=2509454 RepID=A0A5A9XPF9_9BACT|nr:PilZ domain-containing protein [Oryzomonas rubra]KAA0893491.1 PilZ domain-containing protein [Oryzomonas rubra]